MGKRGGHGHLLPKVTLPYSIRQTSCLVLEGSGLTMVASTFFPKQARATLTSYHIQEGKGVAMVTITSDRDCDKKCAGLPWGGGDHDQRPLPFHCGKR